MKRHCGKTSPIASHSLITLRERGTQQLGRFSPIFLMAQRATPSTATGYSPFFLLHEREMTLPSNEELKDKIPITDRNLKQQMEKLKASLKQAYKEVTVANRQAHQTNKRY